MRFSIIILSLLVSFIWNSAVAESIPSHNTSKTELLFDESTQAEIPSPCNGYYVYDKKNADQKNITMDEVKEKLQQQNLKLGALEDYGDDSFEFYPIVEESYKEGDPLDYGPYLTINIASRLQVVFGQEVPPPVDSVGYASHIGLIACVYTEYFKIDAFDESEEESSASKWREILKSLDHLRDYKGIKPLRVIM